jgi:hypothetical protein
MYLVNFITGETFRGGNPNNSKWNEINKPIKSIKYKTPINTILLQDYEAYNHIVERVGFIQGSGQLITKVILMVKSGEDVMKLILDVRKNKIYSKLAKFGKEYNNKPTTGWKEGIKGLKGKSKIL